jgi:hypothetical protein
VSVIFLLCFCFCDCETKKKDTVCFSKASALLWRTRSVCGAASSQSVLTLMRRFSILDTLTTFGLDTFFFFFFFFFFF